MAQDRSVCCSSKPSHHLIANHQQSIFHKIAEQHLVYLDHIAQPELDIFIKEMGISCHKHNFQNPGA